MGVTTIHQEFTTPVPPSRMFKALILDSHNLIPKLMPQAIKSIEYIHGDGGPGSIKQTNLAEGLLLTAAKMSCTHSYFNKTSCYSGTHASEVLPLR